MIYALIPILGMVAGAALGVFIVMKIDRAPEHHPSFCGRCGRPFVTWYSQEGFDSHTGKPNVERTRACKKWDTKDLLKRCPGNPAKPSTMSQTLTNLYSTYSSYTGFMTELRGTFRCSTHPEINLHCTECLNVLSVNGADIRGI